MFNLDTNFGSVVLGTAQFNGTYGLDTNVQKLTCDRACFEILSAAWDLGINKIDTAISYGKAHRVIGEYLASHQHRSYEIVTKANLFGDDELFQAKNFLSIENVCHGTILLHKQDQIFNGKLVKKIRLAVDEMPRVDWGLSAYDHMHGEKAVATKSCSSIQIPVSLLNQDFIHSGFIHHAKSKGLKVTARSIYTLGLIFREHLYWHDYPSAVKDMMSEIKKFSDSYNVSIPTIALQFVIEKADVDEVIMGVNSTKQLKKNIGGNFPPELKRLLSYCLEQSKQWDSSLFRPELWNH